MAAQARRIGSYFQHDVLAQLGMPADFRELPQVSGAWNRVAGEPLCRHVRPVRYVRGELSLRADSAVWAGRVRYRQQTLIAELQHSAEFRHLTGLNVRIAPPQMPHAAAASARRLMLSAGSRSLLEQVAEHVDDAGLRMALVRLSRNGGGR